LLSGMSDMTWVILGGALVTYVTRFGGHAVLSRFKHIPPRVAAGLNAVPAAVLTTLFAPVALIGGWKESLTLAVVLVVGLRFNVIAMLATSVVVIAFLRHLF